MQGELINLLDLSELLSSGREIKVQGYSRVMALIKFCKDPGNTFIELNDFILTPEFISFKLPTQP